MRKSTIVMLVGAAAFAGWIFYSLLHVEPIRVVNGHLEHDGSRVFVTGRLENTGPATGPIAVEVRYYDAQGHALGSDQITVDKLEKGADADFRTPSRDADRVSEFSIYLNHGRNPYGN